MRICAAPGKSSKAVSCRIDTVGFCDSLRDPPLGAFVLINKTIDLHGGASHYKLSVAGMSKAPSSFIGGLLAA